METLFIVTVVVASTDAEIVVPSSVSSDDNTLPRREQGALVAVRTSVVAIVDKGRGRRRSGCRRRILEVGFFHPLSLL